MNAHFSKVDVESAQHVRSSVEDSAVLDAPSTLSPRVQAPLVAYATSSHTSTLRRSLTHFSTAHHVHEDDDDEEKRVLDGIPNLARAALDTNLGVRTP